jgi:CheY-like chemotaxis protein
MSFTMTIISWTITIAIGFGWILALASPFFISTFCLAVAPPILTISAKQRISSQERVPFKALLIDDQPSSLIILEFILKRMKIDYKIVRSGMEAIREMKRDTYNLIVIDHEMPVMNGAETLVIADRYRKKKQRDCKLFSYREVPVIGFSTSKYSSWDLPELKRFALKALYQKDSNYSHLKKEFSKFLPPVAQVT